jgi:aerobic-type carbon monoxide dehydrogenase small subunit (CoxS/CutS family)
MATIRQLNINGRVYTTEVDAESSLLFVLRDHLDLTGSKYGCGEGQCGACTVLIDGKSRRSCITRVGDVAQRQITTIEGLAVSLLNAKRDSSAAEIARSMEGNICRCGTQPRIVLAIQRAAKAMNESKQ